MKHDQNTPLESDSILMSQTATPSADFIHAISEFFDTDPSDLLVELGYYDRRNGTVSNSALTEASAQ